MEAVVIALTLGAAVLAGDLAGKYLRVPPPCAWILIGSGLSFVPGLHDVTLPADVVLFVFLPALLYWECLNTSVGLIRYDLRVIVLLSVGLVFTTAAAVTGVGVLLGLAPSVALVLGAVLAPTDGTATSNLAPGMRRRIAAIIRGESLMNDGSALALYSVAVTAVVAGRAVHLADFSLRFVYVVAVGVVTGLLVALVIRWLRNFAHRPRIDDTISMLTPFALFLPAELLDASGVVAVVAGGLYLSRTLPRIVEARSRSETYSFWRASTHVINGVLFVLIGLQARSVVETFVHDGWVRLALLCALAYVVVMAVRLAWVPVIAQLIRLFDRRPQQRGRREPFRVHAVIAWSGFRGAVSLAAALALPQFIDDGSPFPSRADIIAVTFVVVLITVFLQGLTFPWMVRRAQLDQDPQAERELTLAETEPVRFALDHLDEDAERLGTPAAATERVREELERKLEASPAAGDDRRVLEKAHAELSLAALERVRDRARQLRDEGRIDDSVLATVQETFDIEELHIQQRGGLTRRSR